MTISKLEAELVDTLNQLEIECLDLIHNCHYASPILVAYHAQAVAYRTAKILVRNAFKTDRYVHVPKPDQAVLELLLKREGAKK